MTRFASLSSSSSAVRGKLQAALYYARKKNRNPNFSQVFAVTLSANNDLEIAGLRNVASWFTQADFVLEFEDTSTAEFTWVTDHWELTTGVFPSASGIATLTQGVDSVSIRWQNAEV